MNRYEHDLLTVKLKSYLLKGFLKAHYSFTSPVLGHTLLTRLSYRALALNCDAPLNDKDGAESRNWRAGKPVRVVRSSKGRRISKYAPEEGNRYDGIYKVQY